MKALITDITALWQGRRFLKVLASRELRARFSGSALGLVWLYAQPLLTLAVFIVVFDIVLQVRLSAAAPGTRSLGVYLVVGMVPWMAFCDAISRGMHSLLDAGAMLKKNALPPVFFPARTVVASVATYLPLMVLVSLIIGLTHESGWTLLLLPLLAAALFLFMFLMAMVLAILAAAMRDVLQVVGFLLSLGVYLSPTLFPIALFPEALRWLFWLNPMTPYILGFQSILLEGVTPEMAVWGAILAWLLLACLLANRVIDRSRDQLVDWL